MKHSNVKVPQAQAAIFPNATKSVVTLVATPQVKRQGRHPRLMTLASSHKCRVGCRPNRNQVVLTSSQHVLAIWRPAHTCQSSVVGKEQVLKPVAPVSAYVQQEETD